NFGVPFEARPDTVSTSPRSNRRDAGEKRRTAARHDSEAAAQECDRPELTHDETGVAEYVTCSDDSADRHRTPRATRIAQASFHSPGNSRCTELVILARCRSGSRAIEVSDPGQNRRALVRKPIIKPASMDAALALRSSAST